MSGLRESLAEYLAVRRALGYRPAGTERLLRQFLDYLDAAGIDQITVEHAVAWATRPAAGGRAALACDPAGSGFARYLRDVDPSRGAGDGPAARPPRRAVPCLYTPEQILGLIEAASTLRSAPKTATFRTLLIVTGMRIGKAIAADFDAGPGTLIIPPREVRQVQRAAAAPQHDRRADALPASPGPPSARGPDGGAARLDRRHEAVVKRRADGFPGAAGARGDPAALGCVPAAAA